MEALSELTLKGVCSLVGALRRLRLRGIHHGKIAAGFDSIRSSSLKDDATTGIKWRNQIRNWVCRGKECGFLRFYNDFKRLDIAFIPFHLRILPNHFWRAVIANVFLINNFCERDYG